MAPGDNGIDFVRGVARVHCGSPFSRLAMAKNLGLQGHAIEGFLAGKELPDAALRQLVDLLFHGRAKWDADAQCIADVEKPSSTLPATALNVPAWT